MGYSSLLATLLCGQPPTRDIVVDAREAGRPFPHFWEQVFGSGRAILSLRDSYRRDLRATKAATAIQYVRFHAIFHDEVGVYEEAGDGKPVYNWSYVDQIYDGLLENGVRPWVEMSFMPRKLAASLEPHAFWYKPLPSPPKDYGKWEELVYNFARHLVDRYGIDEVTQWYFEVWNEPNIDFWTGQPKQATYFDLYDHAARAIKRTDSRLRVGGPATAQAAWVSAMIDHCVRGGVPLDFVSTHVYANDSAEDVFGTHENIPRSNMVARAVRKVYDEVKHSPRPDLPIHWTEYNASYKNEVDVTDSAFMGPWLANTIRQCDGLATTMSYWTFSDVFEEQGVIKTPFYGGFGLIAEDGIPKPALNAFAMLHQLGNRRIKVDSDSALATRRSDGGVAIALWNYAPPFGTGATYTPPPANIGPSKTFTVKVTGASPNARVQLWRLDADHGNVIKSFDAMGRPAFPTRDQITQLRAAGRPFPPQNLTLTKGALTITLPPQGLVVIRLSASTASH